MNWIKQQYKLISKAGVFMSGVLILIYIQDLLKLETFWSAFKTMQITMYWFSVAFFFRLGAKQIIYIFIYAFLKGLAILGIAYLLNYLTNSTTTIIKIYAIWVYFNTLTSSMVNRSYADYTYYSFVWILHNWFNVGNLNKLQDAYNEIMDSISLETSNQWIYYTWIYFTHKKAILKNTSLEMCTTTRIKPHEGWMVFYFENILFDEKYDANLNNISVFQPYTSLLGMEGTERVAEAISKFLLKHQKQDELFKKLDYIYEEMRQETLIMGTKKSPL